MIVKWCKCGRRILTMEQMEKEQPCETCQKETSASIHSQFNIDRKIKKEEER